MDGVLSVVATPIGNLGDITLRALDTLRAADVIFCEDTRVTAKLLAKYDIQKPLVRADESTQSRNSERLLTYLSGGKKVALVTDAGTPGVSDPAAMLVAAAREQGHKVEAIPGPSALTAALSISGLPITDFLFLGFLPHKKGRQTLIKEVAATKRAVVLYESPHRIVKLMNEIEVGAPSRNVTIAREITKLFEEVVSGTPQEIRTYLEKEKKDRGEFVVIIQQQ